MRAASRLAAAWAAVLLGLPGCAARAGYMPESLPAFQAEGRVAVSNRTLEGRPALLAFWRPDCPPCLADLPELDAVYRAHRSEGLLAYAVDVDGDLARARAVARQLGLTMPVIAAPGLVRALRIEATPTTYLVAPSGRVSAMVVGIVGRRFFENEIAAALVRHDG